MGAWNVGIYDNDTALDFIADMIDDAFKKARLNNEFLVLADLIRHYDANPTQEECKIFKKVINDELDRLENWVEKTRENRKSMLLDLLKWINECEGQSTPRITTLDKIIEKENNK
jgi:hypothetical protein